MRLPAVLTAILVGGVMCGAPSVATAEPSEDDAARARVLFTDATAKLDAGDLEGAIADYTAAYELVPRPAILLNLAAVQVELGHKAEFANTYQTYLNHPEADPTDKAEVTALLAEADRDLGLVSIEVVGGGAIEVDGRPVKVGGGNPVLWRVPPGRHTIAVRGPGGRLERTVAVDAGARESIRFDTPVAEPAPPTPATAMPDRDADSGPPLWSRPEPWLLGSSVALLATGTTFGFLARASKSDWEDARARGDRPSGARLEDQTRKRALIANISFVLAGGTAIGAGVTYLLRRRSKRDSGLTLAPSAGMDGLVVGWRVESF